MKKGNTKFNWFLSGKSFKKSFILPPVILYLLALMLSAQTSLAEDTLISSVSRKPDRVLTQDEARSLSLAAARIVKHTVEARSALAEKDSKLAQQEVGKALQLAKIIEDNAPTYTVTTEISSPGAKYKDVDPVKNLIVPIYSEFERVDVIASMQTANNKTKAKPGLQVKKANMGISTGKSNKSKALAVEDTEADYTAAYLDVRLAKTSLEMAQTSLADNNTTKADAALKDVLTGLVFEYDVVDLPIVRARENLILALSYAELGKLKEARVALNKASDAVDEYAQSSGKAHSKEVENLRDEVRKYAKLIEREKDFYQLKKKIYSWWNSLVQWTKKKL